MIKDCFFYRNKNNKILLNLCKLEFELTNSGMHDQIASFSHQMFKLLLFIRDKKQFWSAKKKLA